MKNDETFQIGRFYSEKQRNEYEILLVIEMVMIEEKLLGLKKYCVKFFIYKKDN